MTYPVTGDIAYQLNGNIGAANLANGAVTPAKITFISGLVSALPAASAALAGAVGYVSDANGTTPGATVAGSGTHHTLVVCDGSNWKIAVSLS